MRCRKAKRKLSAYLDNELNDKEKQFISQHLQKCKLCQNELTSLSQQDKYLRQLSTLIEIDPSLDFRVKFWQKVDSLEQVEIKKLATRRISRLAWFPIPAMSILIVLIVFHLFSFSFAVSFKSQDLRNQIIQCTMKRFVISSHLLNPISLLNFCQESCEILCKCAQNQGISSKCKCGKCNKNIGGM